MSAAVCMTPAAAAGFESILALPSAAAAALRQQKPIKPMVEEDEHVNNDERPPGQFAVWTSIQAQKGKEEPYVHPLMARRSSSLLSQKSLETCTESLGSESGSDDFFSSDDEHDFFALLPDKVVVEEPLQPPTQQEERAYVDEDDHEALEPATKGKRELVTVNYHCSISRRSSLPRSFPPPLPSISRRDGPCLQMRPHRVDGRLVVEAVTVPSQNYLHAERHNGRLLLSFIDTTSSRSPSSPRRVGREAEATREEEEAMMMMMIDEAEAEAEADPEDQDEADAEEEDEVEVVDRGTVVEVKVSTQPQQLGAAATKKVHRSSIVINKFVSCTPAIAGAKPQETATDTEPAAATHPRRLSTATTTAAAAAVAASSVSSLSEGEGRHTSTNDNKLLFTSRRRSREGLLHDMSRCSQLRKPLFIWEPCCIATSS